MYLLEEVSPFSAVIKMGAYSLGDQVSVHLRSAFTFFFEF
jgi:hypothetical protein